jgi:protein-disulfide isomerase
MDVPDGPVGRRALLAGVGAVAATGGVVVGADRLASQSSDDAPVAGDGPPFHATDETTGFGVDLAGAPVVGSPDASVDLYYWSDYQCPFCRRFERNALQRLLEEPVAAGDVRIAFFQYPYLGKGSARAARFDRCVWRVVRDDRPAGYYDWHRALYERQGERGSGWLSRTKLRETTRDVDGVDASAVTSCLEAHGDEVAAGIGADVERARRYGIRGTPAFVVYGRETDAAGKMMGAQPYERFETAIRRVENA